MKIAFRGMHALAPLILLILALVGPLLLARTCKHIVDNADKTHTPTYKNRPAHKVDPDALWPKSARKNKRGRGKAPRKYEQLQTAVVQDKGARVQLRRAHQSDRLAMDTARYHRANSDATENKRSVRTKVRGNKDYHYHDYAILIVHYHKTGYVLSRELKNLIRHVEIGANRPDLYDMIQDGKEYKRIVDPVKFETSGIDRETGDRISFDGVGNWARSAFQQRRHDDDTHCMRNRDQSSFGQRQSFTLQKGKVYVQESPDLFCSISDIYSSMNLGKGGTKIIHLVRNPFDMALSNYFYHSQDPTPEPWVHTDDPCHDLYNGTESLSSFIVPTLASWTNSTTNKAPKIMQTQMDDIVAMCKSLYQNDAKMEKATFYEHLLKLKRNDGLRLATAQMTIASGDANNHLAGGDLLRMANNIVKFRTLQQSSQSKVHLLTLSMDDFIKNTTDGTLKFLDFVFGENNEAITDELRRKAALKQELKYETQKQKGKHVTQEDSKKSNRIKKSLRDMLKMDKHFGPILNLTEILVNEALSVNE
mmetsp:Transcript_5715/g.14275  ORF Transcript_5715/g.14275 Transcript_5715/m.14275 type:complete len:534 (+) Transcript_5715:207-1808(+)